MLSAEHDINWASFDSQNHFLPKVNNGEFILNRGDDLMALIAEPLYQRMIEEGQIETFQQLNLNQKSLLFWWILDGQVSNGGFYQYFSNGYSSCFMATVKCLESVGDKKMNELLSAVCAYFMEHREAIEKTAYSVHETDEVVLIGLEKWNNSFYKIKSKFNERIEKLILKQPELYCVAESGLPIDLKYSGESKTHYPNGNLKSTCHFVDGSLNGWKIKYHFNGNKDTAICFNDNVETGEYEYFNEDGTLTGKGFVADDQKTIQHNRWHLNGTLKSTQYTSIDDNLDVGCHKAWYENGHLMSESFYDDEGNIQWSNFFHENGNIKTENLLVDGDLQAVNHWREDGVQLLVNGSGLLVDESVDPYTSEFVRTEIQYKNGLQNGENKTYRNGVLRAVVEMKDDAMHGYCRYFYNNGKLKEEIFFENGDLLSKDKFDMFDAPVFKASINADMNAEWMVNSGYNLPDAFPVLLNADECVARMKLKLSMQGFYDQDVVNEYTFTAEIDQAGKIVKQTFLSSNNMRFEKEILKQIEHLRFTPAIKEGQTVMGFAMVTFKFYLVEGGD